MNWDAIGAIGEVAAALAVIITLIYLSRQIRNAATESRLAAIHDLSTSYTSWINSVAASEQLSDIWDRGLTNFSSLNRVERTRFRRCGLL